MAHPGGIARRPDSPFQANQRRGLTLSNLAQFRRIVNSQRARNALRRVLDPTSHAALVGNVILSKDGGERALLRLYLEAI